MEGYSFLFWAYLAIWLGIAGYLFFIMTRTRSVERRLDAVEAELERRS